MAGELGTAYVRIRPNLSAFESELTGGLRKSFASAAKLAGLAIGAAEGVRFLKDAVESAAQLQKSTEVVTAGFGHAGEAVTKFNETAAAQLGISSRVGEDTAARFAILFKNMGIGQSRAAEMTVGFEKLAGTLSAVRGQDPSDVMQRITLAAAGNLRGLKQLGIVIDQHQIKIAALTLGLISNVKDGITPAIKAQAIYALATEKLGQFQQQAAAHSDDAATRMRRLAAEWSNAKDQLGAALLPLVSRLADMLARELPVAIDIVKQAFRTLRDDFDRFGEPIVKFVGGWKSALSIVAGAFVGLKVAAIASSVSIQAANLAAAIGVSSAWKAALISTGFGALAVAAGAAAAYLITHWKQVKDFFEGLWEDIKRIFHRALNALEQIAINGVLNIIEPFSHIPRWLGGGWAQDLKKSLQGALDKLQAPAQNAGTAIGDAIGSNALAAMKPYTDKMTGIFKTVADAIAGVEHVVVGASSTKGVTGPITPGLGALENTLRALGGSFYDDYAKSGHATHSFHYKGEAVDIAPNAAVAKYLAAHKQAFAELFIPTNLPGGGLYNFGQAFKDAKLQQEHMDHIHVAFTGTAKQLKAALDGAGSSADSLSERMKKVSDSTDTTTKAAKKASDAVKENLATSFRQLVAQAGKLGDDVTPGITGGISRIRALLGNVVTTEDAANVRAKMGSLRQTISEHLQKIQEQTRQHVAAIKAQLDAMRAAFEGAFGRLTSRWDAAFDDATQKALNAMQVMVRAAGGSFLFGGDITQTPTEKLLADMQAADEDARRQKALSDAVAAGDKEAQAAAEKDILVAKLQAQALIERDAANKQLADAQDAYRSQRDLLKQQMDDRVEAIRVGLEKGTITAAAGMQQLTDVLGDPKYGLELKNTGYVIAGKLYEGLSDGLKPVLALLDGLIDKMRQAGLLKGDGASGGTGGHPSAAAAANFLLNPSLTPAQIAAALGQANQPVLNELKRQTQALEAPKEITPIVIDGGASRIAAAVPR